MNTVKQTNQIKCIMFKYCIIILLSTVIAISLGKNVMGQSISIHQEIENNIQTYIKSQLKPSPYNKIKILISKIDRRKKLSSCPQALKLKVMGKSGIKKNNTINVSCIGQWRIFVPVTIETLTPVVTAKQNIAIGELLTPSNAFIEYLDISHVFGQTITNINEVFGSKSKRYIQHGRPVLMNLICMICKNEQVSITAINKGLKIKSSGVALSDGSKGQKIPIRNNSSGRIIEAVVVSIGNAEIKL